MRVKSIFTVGLLVLCVVSLADGWQNQPAATGPGVTTAQPPRPPAPPYFGGQQSYGQPYPPITPYSDRGGAAHQAVGAQDAPTYPYPPYHNPYYDGTSARNFVNGTIEWVFGLPSMALDGVANFLDNKFFPQQPATSGGTPEPAPAPRVPATQAPLPPASTYTPPAR
jgi:hypothetical protein